MTDLLAQLGELPTTLLMGMLGVVMLADAVPLLGVLVPGDAAVLAAVGAGRPATGLATVVAVVAGCLAGWSLSFLAGRRWGEQLRRSRLGDWIGEPRWAAAEALLRRGGGRMVLVAPFLPVFNALLPLAAGGLRMSYRRFAACAALGATLWAGLYVALGITAQALAGLLPGAPNPTVLTMLVGLLLAGPVLLGTRHRLRAVTGANAAERVDPRRSPAAGPPLRQRGALGAERAVLAVTRVEPGLVGQPVEKLPLDVVDELAEPLRVLLGVAHPAREERVPGEQVWHAGRVAVEQRDRTRGVPLEVDHLQRAVADRHGVAIA